MWLCRKFGKSARGTPTPNTQNSQNWRECNSPQMPQEGDTRLLSKRSASIPKFLGSKMAEHKKCKQESLSKDGFQTQYAVGCSDYICNNSTWRFQNLNFTAIFDLTDPIWSKGEKEKKKSPSLASPQSDYRACHIIKKINK